MEIEAGEVGLANDDANHSNNSKPAVVIGYQAPDVQMQRACDESFLRISHNDSGVAGLIVSMGLWSDDNYCQMVYDVISKSVHLRQLTIRCNSWTPKITVQSLCRAISQNRSIEHFTFENVGDISHEDIFPMLAPFFQHNHNLRCIEMTGSEGRNKIISTGMFTILEYLSRTNKLERLDLSENYLGANKSRDIFNAL